MVVHYLLVANGAILLLQLDHFFVHLSSGVVVRQLRLLSNDSGFVLWVIVSTFLFLVLCVVAWRL